MKRRVLRLPPRYYNTPTKARFRKHRLPPELWDTWELINALSWINDYKFTPPVSFTDLAEVLRVDPRTVQRRILRLESLHWAEIQRASGETNVYVLRVPDDTPDSCGESASLSSSRNEDSSGASSTPATAPVSPTVQTTVQTVDLATQDIHVLGSISTAVAAGTFIPDPDKNLPATADTSTTRGRAREKMEIAHIAEALWDLDIRDEEAVDEILGFAHVTPEYVEDWFCHRKRTAKPARWPGDEPEYTLGGGYYRMQIREKRESPYAMSAQQRAEYRAQKDAEWEKSEMARQDEGEQKP